MSERFTHLPTEPEPDDQIESLPPLENANFAIFYPDSVVDANRTRVEYRDKTDVVVTSLKTGTQAFEPAPMGTVKVGKNLAMPVVGRVEYDQGNAKDYGRTTVTSRFAIVDTHGFVDQMADRASVRLGPYPFKTHAGSDSRPQFAARYALVDLRALQQDVVDSYSTVRHFVPLSQDEQRPTKVSTSGMHTSSKFEEGYGASTRYEGMNLTQDDNGKIVLTVDGYAAGKFTIATAHPVEAQYKGQHSQLESAIAEFTRQKNAASLGDLSINGLLSSIFNDALVVGSGQPKPLPEQLKRPKYELKIDARITDLQAQGLSPNQIRRELSRQHAPDVGGSKEAMGYVNQRADKLNAEAKEKGGK